VADYMMANKYDFLPFMDISEGEFDSYCNKTRTASTWGGQLEIQALTNILKTPIEIYSASSPVVRMGEEFNEEKPLLLSYVDMRLGTIFNNISTGSDLIFFFLRYHKHMYTMGEHYNSIVENSTVEF